MRIRILRIYEMDAAQQNATTNTSVGPVVGSSPPAVAPQTASQVQYLSPLFFTSAIAGSILVLLLIAFFVYALRKLGFCAARESVMSPEEEEAQRRREDRARMRRLRCGVPPHIISSFPVYVYGSEEFEAAMKELQKDFLQANRCKDLDSECKDSASASDGLLSSECGLQCGIVKGNSNSSCANSEACASNGGKEDGWKGTTPKDSEAGSHKACEESPPLEFSHVDTASAGSICLPVVTASDSSLLLAAPYDPCTTKGDAAVIVSLPDADDCDQPLSPSLLTPGPAIGKCQDCSVCLAEFEKGEDVKLLPPCGHYFHVHCITEWLCFRRTCPVCRCSLVKKSPPPSLAVLLTTDPHGVPIEQQESNTSDRVLPPSQHQNVPSTHPAPTAAAQELTPPVAASPQAPIAPPPYNHSMQQ